jgi:hypothetical protein
MPAVNLEALVGHLFVVGGRSISAASPGAIAMAAPRRAARGRDADTLFGLISLSAEQRQPASFYENLTGELSGKYFGAAGSLTSALREAIGTVNATLHTTTPSHTELFSVGLACAILREQELIVALVGPARCFVMHENAFERLPGDDEVLEGLRPLGADAEPDIRLYRREIQANDFVILCDASLNRARDAAIQQAVGAGEVDQALNNLRGVAGEYASAEVIKFVAPQAESQAAPAEPSPAVGAHQPATHARAEDEAAFSPNQLPMTRRVGRSTALGLAQMISGVQTLVRKMLPDLGAENPLEERFQLPLTTQIGVAVGVAVVVAVLTTIVYQSRGQTSQYAQLVRDAQKEIDQAQAGGNDQAAARPHWETAVFLLGRAAQIHTPGSDVGAMHSEALTALDSYDHVTRVKPALLRGYEAGSVLKGPIVQGANMYVIDTTKDILYREDLDQSGTSLVNHDSQIITRQGDVLNNLPVGGLIDLAWMEDGGVPQKNVLAVLSRNGLLITYSPSWNVTVLGLPGFEAWQDPRAMAIYNRDLYILDAGANEIWRYQAGPDSYSSLPQRYFTDVVPQFNDAIDMKIDTNGNIYVLHATGLINKYFFGREQDFSFVGLPQPIARPAALNLSLNLIDRVFYIADPGGGRLYSTALNGTFLTNYKDSQDSIFSTITGAFGQDRPAVVYVAAGNGLYYFPRPQ